MIKRGKVQTNQKKRRESAIVDHVMVKWSNTKETWEWTLCVRDDTLV